mgnify:CR=1 FL=1
MNKRTRNSGDEIRHKTIKVRFNDRELAEFNAACETLEVEKSYVVREGIRLFLESQGYIAE